MIVFGLVMTDPRDNRQGHGLLIELLGSSRSPDSAAMLAAGMLGDLFWCIGGTSGVQASNYFGEFSHVSSIHCLALDLLAPSPDRPLLFVAQAFLLSLFDCFGLSEDALAFISLAGPAPLQDNRGEA